MQYVGYARPANVGAILRIGPQPLSVYWSNPSRGLHAAGLGVAGIEPGDVQWMTALPVEFPPGPWFGGWPFDAAGEERWVLPEVLAWWSVGGPYIAAFGPAGTSSAELEKRLDRVTEVEPQVEGITARATPRSRDAWDALVTDALRAIEAGTFEKVVCARVIDVQAEHPWSERAVLRALEARHPSCFTFLLRTGDGDAFVGASPELLGEGSGSSFSTDALAGTAAKGEGAALLTSEKDRREHQSVIDGIRESLGPFVTGVSHDAAPRLKVLANVEHLHTPITATLTSGASLIDVTHALHPTPAVAGRPRAAAVEWLRAHEGFQRGWYTGAVGVRNSQSLTMCVALRSALISGASARVFVGAGIVRGSTPEAEWLETERKARAVLPALGVFDA